MVYSCRFCTRLTRNYNNHEDGPWDRVLFQSTNFVAFPTIGALIEGWILLVPKEHYLCMGALNDDLLFELYEFQKFVSQILKEHYGPITVFEHGPSKPKQAVGCGVDHAHLHILPTTCDLISGVREVFNCPLQWKTVKGIKDTMEFYNAGLSYLYVEQPEGEIYISTHPNLQSQLFRKVIATSIGKSNHYDWKSYNEKQNVESTIRMLDKCISSNSMLIETTNDIQYE